MLQMPLVDNAVVVVPCKDSTAGLQRRKNAFLNVLFIPGLGNDYCSKLDETRYGRDVCKRTDSKAAFTQVEKGILFLKS
jgi:hypothetical protein